MEQLRHRLHSAWAVLVLSLIVAIVSDSAWVKAGGGTGIIVALAYLLSGKRNMRPMPVNAVTVDMPNPTSLPKVLVTHALVSAGIVFLLDWVAGPLLEFMSIGAALLSIFRLKPPPGERRTGFYKAAIYCVAALLAFQISKSRHSADRESAEQIIKGIECYRQQFGVFPERLDELEPSIMPVVPRSHYGPYLYWQEQNAKFLLSYIDLPPGGRCYYASDKKIWQCEAE